MLLKRYFNYVRLPKDEYQNLPEGTKQKRIRRGAVADVVASERAEGAIASGERTEDAAAKERREYLKRDTILGARKDLRSILERDKGPDNEGLSGPYRGGTGSYAGRNLTGGRVSASPLRVAFRGQYSCFLSKNGAVVLSVVELVLSFSARASTSSLVRGI